MLTYAHYMGKKSSLDLAKVVISDKARATKKKSFFSHIESFCFGDDFKNVNLLFIIEYRGEACKFDMHVSLTPHSFDISSASNTSLSTVIVIFSLFFNFYVV